MITLFKGDSATSRFGRELTFTIDTTLDTTGCSVLFAINGVEAQAQFNGSEAVVSLTAQQVGSLEYGTGFASLALVAGTDRYTLKNDIAVTVTDCVADVQGSSNTIDITMAGAWENALDGVDWNAGGSIASLRDFLARVGVALGASVTAR